MLNQRLREIRLALNLSQTDFGVALGSSRSAIANYEYGRVEPRKAFLDLVCSIFNVNSDWLSEGTGEMFQAVVERDEPTEIYQKLSPAFQEYALEQMKGLLKVQEQSKGEE